MASPVSFYKIYRSFINKRAARFGIQQNARCCNSITIKDRNHSPALQSTSEDLSEVTPYFSDTFNLAAYVNNSETLKNLVNLNVNLSKIEKKPQIVEKLLKLDFERDMKKHVIFLSDFIDMHEVGNFLTKNPLILCELLEDLEVRVNYMKSKSFDSDQIKRIISANPFWLMFSTVRIDKRLGFYQQQLSLSGNEVRYIATKQPRLITYNLHHVNTNLFVVKEEMGFKDEEVKKIVLNKPRLLMLNQKNLLERFNYIHNVMKIPHKTILEQPEILFCRNFKIKQRHLFLEKLGRSQYNPQKENFVPIKSLCEHTDSDFCRFFAKCSVNDYNLFLKTL